MTSFKNKIHNWIKDAEHERKEQLSSKSRSVTSKHSSSRNSSSSSFFSRWSKDKRALQEKLRMVELLAEAEFLKKRQSAKIQEEKLKIEEEYAKSKAKVEILEAIESEDHIREFNVDGQYKGEINKAMMKNQKFSMKELSSIIMIKQLLVMGSSTSVLSSSHSMRK